MTSILIPDYSPNLDNNIFDCLSTVKECYVPAKEVPVYDYMISVYPRNENDTSFTFVYSLFHNPRIPFGINQDSILAMANDFFRNSFSLTDFESNVLNNTFKKSSKSYSSLSGRK